MIPNPAAEQEDEIMAVITNIPGGKRDLSRVAYQRPQPAGMIPEVFISGALDLDTDERLWVPQGENVWFKPLLLSPGENFYINLLKVNSSGILSRHRHNGAVHGFTLSGSWHYLEHDWIAKAGDYVFEPPGETHTLVIPEGADHMVTLFHVTGGYVYVDPQGAAQGYEDVFTKLEAARAHYETVGLGESYLDRIMCGRK